MSNLRAYKIAEELGIERNEFVEKVRALGIDLKSAMAPLDDEQCAFVREKLGGKALEGAVTEARVERRGGAAVIRRRKRIAEPEPEPGSPAVTLREVAEVSEPPGPAIDEDVLGPEPGREVEGPGVLPGPVLPPPSPARPAPPEPAQPGPESAAEGGRAAPATDRKGRQRKQFKEVVNLREQEQLARQVTSRTSGRQVAAVDPRAFASPRRKRRDRAPVRPAAASAPRTEKRVVRVEGSISVAELARQLGAKSAEVQGKLMGLGIMVSVNQMLELDVARQVVSQYGFEVQDVGFREDEFFEAEDAGTAPENMVSRPPVVTVMGHVDHGKTSLLDAIRKANVVAGEAGGITQHIGAYQARVGEQAITFIDTPGHAAFTAMRARGAQVTDVVILVVAATEGIMPQTVEAIDHAKAAGVPIVVAVNKCDLPDANPQQARQRLMEHGLVPEDFGGDVLCVNVSATKRSGIEKLLEAVLLQAELLELRADPTRRAQAVVLEAELDKGRGPVATVLVQHGTLSRGDIVVSGVHHGRVRSMCDEHGQIVKEAGPSSPVQVVGLSGVPAAGDSLNVVESERVAKQIVDHRVEQQRRQPEAPRPRLTLEDLFEQAESGGVRELAIVVKGDADGSVEAVRDTLLKLPTDKVKLNVIHAAVGAITESDVQLARASNAIVIGFHVRPDAAGRRAAENHGVDVRVYQIIYELIDEVRNAMAGLLPPTVTEVFLGRAEVRQTFTVPRIGTIAGCYVTEGLVRRNAPCRLLRDSVQVYQGRLGSLKRFKDDAREVQTGFECGIGIDGYNDIKVGDVIEAYELKEERAEL